MIVVLIPALILVFQSEGCIRRQSKLGLIRIPMQSNRISVADACDGEPREKILEIKSTSKSKFSFCSDLRIEGRLIHSVGDAATGNTGEIGIGPNSDLVRKFGNVAVVADELVLGDSHPSYFRASCVYGSGVFIPLEEFGGSVGFTGAIGASDQVIRFEIHGDTEFPFIVPDIRGLVNRVLRKFPRLKIVPGESFACNKEVIDLLNPLDINFGGTTIRIEPVHYIVREGEVCRLKLNEQYNRAAINPLAIPGKNVKFTDYGLELCDRREPQVL